MCDSLGANACCRETNAVFSTWVSKRLIPSEPFAGAELHDTKEQENQSRPFKRYLRTLGRLKSLRDEANDHSRAQLRLVSHLFLI